MSKAKIIWFITSYSHPRQIQGAKIQEIAGEGKIGKFGMMIAYVRLTNLIRHELVDLSQQSHTI